MAYVVNLSAPGTTGFSTKPKQGPLDNQQTRTVLSSLPSVPDKYYQMGQALAHPIKSMESAISNGIVSPMSQAYQSFRAGMAADPGATGGQYNLPGGASADTGGFS